jgi:hypothetical protein
MEIRKKGLRHVNTKQIVPFLVVVVLLGSGVYWFAARHAQAQTAGSEVPVQFAWEYAELYVTEFPSKKQTQIMFLPPNKIPGNSSIFDRGRLDANQTYFSALDLVGNLGWELVQVRHNFSQKEPYRTIYYFKRRKL